MDESSEAILALEPVTFHYRTDAKGTPQFGLVAEEVAAVNPDLVVRDKDGEIYTVRYEAVNAMLLNEFLKEHRRVEELQSKSRVQERWTEKQEAIIAQQQKQIDTLTAAVRKVSDRIELAESARPVVASGD
jgi:uncharacterized coiled-coil protein SlyX